MFDPEKLVNAVSERYESPASKALDIDSLYDDLELCAEDWLKQNGWPEFRSEEFEENTDEEILERLNLVFKNCIALDACLSAQGSKLTDLDDYGPTPGDWRSKMEQIIGDTRRWVVSSVVMRFVGLEID